MKIKITEIEADARELRESNTLAQNFGNILKRAFMSCESFEEEECEDEGEEEDENNN